MAKYIIFAIDNDDDLHTNAKFLRYMDERRVMGKMDGTMVLCIGSYNDALERSYMVTESDFFYHVAASGFVDDQQSVLEVSDGHKGKTYATLKFKDERADNKFLGVFKSISPYEIGEHSSWTYRSDMGIYFVTEEV